MDKTPTLHETPMLVIRSVFHHPQLDMLPRSRDDDGTRASNSPYAIPMYGTQRAELKRKGRMETATTK